MERRLKELIISELIDSMVKFSLAFFLSYIGLKLLMEFEISKKVILTSLKSQTDIMVGLSLIYLVYFAYFFYKKIDSYIFDEVDKLIYSINENSYKEEYKTYEFKKISDALNNKTQEIIKKDKDLVKGISYISHDMKTPLTVINTNVSLIKKSNEKISDKNLIRMDRIFEESEKISTYIDKIMKIAKSQLEENKIKKIKLGDIVKSLEKNIIIYSDMLEEEIEIAKQIENNKKLIYANTSNINECLIHLLNNAYEHRNAKMKVEIKAKDRLEISVIDDGLGFDEDIIGESTDLFVTSNVARTLGNGYGIGLYYVKTYLEKISGELELINKNQGAIAKMIIPMEDSDD